MMFPMLRALVEAVLHSSRKERFPEILLIDKPKGITSFDVIRILKQKYGLLKIGHARNLKIGHAGTLDPLATGLLIVGIGEGTKRMNEFLKLPKSYKAHIVLGIKTDTGDMEGKVIEKKAVHSIDEGSVRKMLSGMLGKLLLPVPVYSAVKRGGVPLYKRARRGEKVVPPIKEMEIKEIKLLDVVREKERVVLLVEMAVGSGTYVRSVAEEIGRRLGVPAVVGELRRMKIGTFDVHMAKRLEDI